MKTFLVSVCILTISFSNRTQCLPSVPVESSIRETNPDAFLPQDEPQKQIQDPAKSPQAKEEGSMNILNSHSPKHENNRPTSVIHDQGRTPNNAEEYTEVNMLQNNLV